MPEDIKSFEIGDDDAALVISKDLSAKMYLPTYDDAHDMSFEEHQNVYIVIAIMMSLDKPEFQAIINKELDVLFAKANNMTSGGCGSGCGGCGTKEPDEGCCPDSSGHSCSDKGCPGDGDTHED